MSSFVVTPLDPIPESPPGPQPARLSTWQLDVNDDVRGLSAIEAEPYLEVDRGEAQYARVNRAAYLRLETPTPLQPISRKSSLPDKEVWVDSARHSLQGHVWSSDLDALDLDRGQHSTAMDLTYDASEISDLRGSRTPPGHLSAAERTPRSSVELARRRTSSGVSSTSSKRDQFLPPALLSPVATSTGTEPTFDVYARNTETGALSTSSLPDQSDSPASPFAVTSALSLLRRLTPNPRKGVASPVAKAEGQQQQPAIPAGEDLEPEASDTAAEGRRMPSTSDASHPSRDPSSQSDEQVRVSGTFGVRDSFASAAYPGPDVLPPPERYLRPSWQSEAGSEEDLQSENPSESTEAVLSRATTDQQSSQAFPVNLRPAEQIAALKQRRRDTFIVGNYAGTALAEATLEQERAVADDAAATTSDGWHPQGTLREIFPGSDWKLVAPPGHGDQPTREPTVRSGISMPRPGGPLGPSSRGPGLRLPSLTESELEHARIEQVHGSSGGFGQSSVSAPTEGPRLSHSRASAGSQQTSDTALLLASSILSQHAASLLQDVTVQHSEARKLRQMAHDALDAGRLLLDLAGTDEQTRPGQRNSIDRGGQRKAAFEALTARTPPAFRTRSRSPTVLTSPRTHDSMSAIDPRAYRLPPTAMLNARAVVRPRTTSLPGDLLSDVERLSKLGWDKMHEAEMVWQQMIDLLKQNLEASKPDRASSPRQTAKLKRRSASPSLLGGSSRPRPILSPTTSVRRSDSDSTNRPSQQVRFAESPTRKPRKRWFSFLRKRPATVFEPVTA